MGDYKKLPYRMGAIGIVFDENDNVLVVQLNDYSDEEWNFPGGGCRNGEDGEQTILRELSEELGVGKDNFQIIAKSVNVVKYDFPNDMREKKMPIALTFRGQIKEQFFVRYIGNKDEIAINRDELRNYKWVPISDLKEYLIFDGQYDAVLISLNEYYKFGE